ncbi:MAG: hypothetical protein ACTHJ9_00630 [Rhodanobacter sp.]
MKTETAPKFGLGERVVLVYDLPHSYPGETFAFQGEAGTVKLVGPLLSSKQGLRAMGVKLDRTGREITTFEEWLAPEEDTP